MRLCIIADDLTGALDSAAPFAGRGLTVQVALSPAHMPALLSTGTDVIAVSTQSRDLHAADARAAVAAIVGALPPGLRLMKKVDSRLKGHVADELAALDPSRMLVVPAIPAFDRLVRGGLLHGFGVNSPVAVADRLGPLAGRATIPDVATQADIDAALAGMPPDALLVGARGLAEAMALAMTGRPDAVPVRPRAGRSLMVVGSQDPITLAQVDRVRRALPCLNAPLGDLPDASAVAGHPHLLVQAGEGTPPRSPAEVAGALARSIHPALTDTRDALLLTGGATAEAVLAQMGIGVLELRGECLPGLPVSSAAGRCVIAKSGGFGDERTLIDLLGLFQGDV